MAHKHGIYTLLIAVLVLLVLAGCMAAQGLYPGWAAYQAAHKLTGVVFDRAGNLWAGGPGGAVVWHPDGTHSQYTQVDGLVNDSVWAVLAAPDGAIWFGTSGGVARFDRKSWQSYTIADGLADDQVWAVAAAPDGSVWFGTNHGASRFDGTTWQSYTSANGLIDNVVHSILAGPDGAIWFGTEGPGWYAVVWHERRRGGPL